MSSPPLPLLDPDGRPAVVERQKERRRDGRSPTAVVRRRRPCLPLPLPLSDLDGRPVAVTRQWERPWDGRSPTAVSVPSPPLPLSDPDGKGSGGASEGAAAGWEETAACGFDENSSSTVASATSNVTSNDDRQRRCLHAENAVRS